MTVDETEVQHEMVVVRKWTAPLSWLMWVAIVLAVLPNVTPFPDLRIGAGHVLGLMALQIIASWLGSRWAARRVKQRRLSQRAPNGCASRATCLGSDELTRLVQKLRSRNNLISLAAMVMVGGQPTAAAADGLRKKGSRAAAEIGDRWHLGSVTKSMTATMIARLVEAGRIEWITPIISCLDSESEIHPLWGAVMLEQLLTHTSGAPPNFPVRTLFQDPSPGDARRQARARAIEAILRKNRPARPASHFVIPTLVSPSPPPWPSR